MKLLLPVLAWLLLHTAALAGPLALPSRPQSEFTQHLGAQLPLHLVFYDEGGAPAELGNYFHGRPVVLVLGYYQCPNLCSTLMEGVVETLARAGLPRDVYRLVEVSINPAETPELAARKKLSYRPMSGRHGSDMHLLTGGRSAIDLLAQTVGFNYDYDEQLRQYIHPAGFVMATADGRISRYFLGVRFDPDDIKAAMQQAESGGIGTPVARLLLLCSHYDRATGRASMAAMTLVRLACIAVLLTLMGWAWHQHGRQRRGQ
jgi:protein SCO1